MNSFKRNFWSDWYRQYNAWSDYSSSVHEIKGILVYSIRIIIIVCVCAVYKIYHRLSWSKSELHKFELPGAELYSVFTQKLSLQFRIIASQIQLYSIYRTKAPWYLCICMSYMLCHMYKAAVRSFDYSYRALQPILEKITG